MEASTIPVDDSNDYWFQQRYDAAIAAIYSKNKTPTNMPDHREPRRILTANLKEGMTVFQEPDYDRHGNPIWRVDVHLGKRFVTSPTKPMLAFHGKDGGKIYVWHRCGYVYVA